MTETPKENGQYRDEKGKFVVGNPGGPGRPPGAVSPITKIRQIFEENPQKFEEFVKEYIDDPSNRRHLVEMLDGKAKQSTDITSGGEAIQPLLVKFLDGPEDNGDTEGV